MRPRRPLPTVLLAASVVAGSLLAAPSAVQAKSERYRQVAEDYVTSLGGELDCSTNEGGACFELTGDERALALQVRDDEGWTDVPARYEFVDGSGQVLAAGDACGGDTSTVPEGAVALNVAVELATVGACSHPVVSQAGTIAVEFQLKRQGEGPSFDDERKCTGGLGEPVSYTLRPDAGSVVPVQVLVLLDGVGLEVGAPLMEDVVSGFGDVGIDLELTFEPVDLAAASLEVDDLFDAIKAEVGGEVPAGYDLVHVLTTKDMIGWAGYAYCVGGIQSRDHAFSMSEARGTTINIIRGVPSPVWFWGDAYLAAHEIGHLFGGGHDLANCVEGVEVRDGAVPASCTLMHPNLNVSYRFSTINRAVVRGHALDFVD